MATEYDMDNGGEDAENYTAEAATFIATLMVAAPVAHMLHLQTKSYATHKALEELYTGLPEKVDALAECYQGCYGIIAKYPRMALPALEKPIHFVASLIEYVEENREGVADESQIQNLIDEIAQLLDTVAYKLILS
jgi:hypothetical protein